MYNLLRENRKQAKYFQSYMVLCLLTEPRKGKDHKSICKCIKQSTSDLEDSIYITMCYTALQTVA